MKKSIKAFGKNYFKTSGCPLAVQHIAPDLPPHEHDLTLIEHYHDFSELVVIAGGSGIQVINGQEYPVKRGDVFLLNGFSEHYFCRPEQLELYNLQFDAKHLPLPDLFLRKLPGFNVFFLLEPNLRSARGFRKMLHVDEEIGNELTSKLEQLKQETDQQQPGFEAVAFAQFLAIITRLVRQYPQEPADTTNAALVRMGKIISLLEGKFTQNWSLAELSLHACMSPNHFLRLFKQATGESPIAYLIRLRLRYAAALLSKTELSISEIAEQSGFYDSNYFSKQFRNHFHLSPSRYRKQPRL